jgi:hypothetical protein
MAHENHVFGKNDEGEGMLGYKVGGRNAEAGGMPITESARMIVRQVSNMLFSHWKDC